MKILIAFLVCFPFLTHAGEDALRTFRFVEAKTVKETNKLPPTIELTFEIMCNEELVKVVRHEWVEPRSKETYITVGAIVRREMLSSCAMTTVQVKAEAGSSYSGKKYQISRIRTDAP